MKVESILKYALDLRAALDPNNEHSRSEDLETLKAVNQMIPNDPHTLTALIIAECKTAETAPTPAKKARKSKAVKTAEKVLKMARDNYPEHKEFHYPQMRCGMQYITNAVSIIKLINPLPLEEMPYDVAATGPLTLAEQFDKHTRECTTPIDIPTAIELEAYVKTHKGEELITYVLECGMSVNAKYLLDALDILNTKSVAAFTNSKNTCIYIKSPDGSEALVFGRRRPSTQGTTPAQ